jgi:hypothetical protein
MLSVNFMCAAAGFGIGALLGAAVPLAIVGFLVGFLVGMRVVAKRFRDV